jgi:hypothetical protein
LAYLLVLVGLCSALLPACSGPSRPFARDQSWLGTVDAEAPPVTITSIEGIPHAPAARLAGQVYTESRRRGFSTTMNGEELSGFVVIGNMSAVATEQGTAVVYVFDVWDPSRKHQQRIAGEEVIPGGAFADPWSAVDDSALQRIAVDTTDQLAGFISAMGYEIRMASVPPPAGMLSDAADSITTASATGSLYRSPRELGGEDQYASLAGVEAPAATYAASQPDSGATLAAAQVSVPPPAPEPGQPTAIAVPLVVGASGHGNRELAEAMRLAMGGTGLPVVEDRREGALTIVGEVEVKPADGAQQAVALNWKVLAPNGALLGTIAQNNTVPAGSLDRGWGETAMYAAEAAAGGIFELLSKPR